MNRDQVLMDAPSAHTRVERILMNNFDTHTREYVTRWVVDDCPFCGRRHEHGPAEGLRASHCSPGGHYVLLKPDPWKSTATQGGPFTLYRHFDADDRLLYVGRSVSVYARWKQHDRSSAWAPEVASTRYERFPSPETLASAEVAAIKEEKPLYNVAHNGHGRRKDGRR